MAVTILTGYKAAVNGVSCARKWGTTSIAEDVFAICSASKGAPVRDVGNKDWNGFWEAYGIYPAHNPGDNITFQGATETGGGASSITNGAIIKDLRVDWPVANGGFIHHRVGFEAAEGELTYGALMIADAAIPSPKSARKLYATFGGVDITHVTYMLMLLECKNADDINSSSNGIRNRVRGNLDGQAVVRVNIEAFASLPDENTVGVLTLGNAPAGITGVSPWTLTYMKLLKIEPVVDIEGEGGKPKVVGADLQFGFTGYYNGTEGSIVNPAGTTVWPW